MMQPNARATRPFLLAARFLFPLSNDPDPDQPSAWTKAVRWLPVWGLAIGILYTLIYRAAWRWFGEYQRLRLLPPMILLIADLGWFGYRQFAAAVEVFDRKRSPSAAPGGLALPGVTAVMLIGLLKYLLLLALPAGAMVFRADWRQYLSVLYPGVIYRPLLLMPLWGRWAMMLALCIGRVSPDSSPRLRHMASGVRLKTIVGWWFFTGLLTIAYSSPEPLHLAYGVVVALGVLVTSYLASFALARRYDGQTETTVAAAGLIAELAFLIFYLPLARAIYWY
jgi:cobalamin synthase